MSLVFRMLEENQVLLLFILVGIGMLFAWVRVKGISLGAAAVLFFAIGITAWAKADGYQLEVEHDLGILGLALFAFAIGINSGPNFFHTLKSSLGPLVLMLAVFALATGAAAGLGRALGMDWALIAGTFAGAVTNTPALSAASQASGDPAGATVGYAIAYLFGVIGMLGFAMLALSKRRGDKDTPSPIVNRTVRVERSDKPTVRDILDAVGEGVHFSRIRRGEVGPIWIPEEDVELWNDDLITVVGTQDLVERVISHLGHGSSHSLVSDRRYLDFRRMTVSDPNLGGKTVAEVNLENRFGGSMSRIRRGDTDMLAQPDVPLQLGDRVRVVAPTSKMAAISKFFGDSARGQSDINPIALGIGMALGIIIGEWEFLTPSGTTFSIGSAAGTLIMGLIMGRIGRIGRIVTALPYTACQVLSEFGLLVFLAYAGTKAGSQILTAFTGGSWAKILLLGAVVTIIVGAGLYLTMRYIVHMGGTRLSGLLGGAQTQPAVLAFANDRTNADPRVALGYAMVYPVAMIVKIFCGQVLGSFAMM